MEKILKNDHRQFKLILKEAEKLRWRKLNDYGQSYKNFGTFGIVVRLGDKMARISRLINKNNHYYENLRDSAIDMLNYSAMLIMLIDNKRSIKK